MKFLLIVQICSSALMQCEPPASYPKRFDTFYSCAYTGYSVVRDMTYKMGEEYVNKNRVVINFMCKEVMDA